MFISFLKGYMFGYRVNERVPVTCFWWWFICNILDVNYAGGLDSRLLLESIFAILGNFFCHIFRGYTDPLKLFLSGPKSKRCFLNNRTFYSTFSALCSVNRPQSLKMFFKTDLTLINSLTLFETLVSCFSKRKVYCTFLRK